MKIACHLLAVLILAASWVSSENVWENDVKSYHEVLKGLESENVDKKETVEEESSEQKKAVAAQVSTYLDTQYQTWVQSGEEEVNGQMKSWSSTFISSWVNSYISTVPVVASAGPAVTTYYSSYYSEGPTIKTQSSESSSASESASASVSSSGLSGSSSGIAESSSGIAESPSGLAGSAFSLASCECDENTLGANQWEIEKLSKWKGLIETLIQQITEWYSENQEVGEGWLIKAEDDRYELWIELANYLQGMRSQVISLGVKKFTQKFGNAVESKVHSLILQLQKRNLARIEEGQKALQWKQSGSHRKELTLLANYKSKFVLKYRKQYAALWKRSEKAKFSSSIALLYRSSLSWYQEYGAELEWWWSEFLQVINSALLEYESLLQIWYEVIEEKGYDWFLQYGAAKWQTVSSVFSRKLTSIQEVILLKSSGLLQKKKQNSMRTIKDILLSRMRVLVRSFKGLATSLKRQSKQFTTSEWRSLGRKEKKIAATKKVEVKISPKLKIETKVKVQPINVELPKPKPQRPINLELPKPKHQRPINLELPKPKRQRPINLELPKPKRQRPINVELPKPKRQRPINLELPKPKRQRPINLELPKPKRQRPINLELPKPKLHKLRPSVKLPKLQVKVKTRESGKKKLVVVDFDKKKPRTTQIQYVKIKQPKIGLRLKIKSEPQLRVPEIKIGHRRRHSLEFGLKSKAKGGFAIKIGHRRRPKRSFGLKLRGKGGKRHRGFGIKIGHRRRPKLSFGLKLRGKGGKRHRGFGIKIGHPRRPKLSFGLKLKAKVGQKQRRKRVRSAQKYIHRNTKKLNIMATKLYKRAASFHRRLLPHAKWWIKTYKRVIAAGKRQQKATVRITANVIKQRGYKWFKKFAQPKVNRIERILRKKLQTIHKIILRKTAALLQKKHRKGLTGLKVRLQKRIRKLIASYVKLSKRLIRKLKNFMKRGWRFVIRSRKHRHRHERSRIVAKDSSKWLTKFSTETCGCTDEYLDANQWVFTQMNKMRSSLRPFYIQIIGWYRKNKVIGKWWLLKARDDINEFWIEWVRFLERLRKRLVQLGAKKFKLLIKNRLASIRKTLLSNLRNCVAVRIQQGDLIQRLCKNPEFKLKLAKVIKYTPRYQKPSRTLTAKIWRRHRRAKFGAFIRRIDAKMKGWYKRQTKNVKFGYKFYRLLINRVYGNFVGTLNTWYLGLKHRGRKWYVNHGKRKFNYFSKVTKRKTISFLKAFIRKSKAILGGKAAILTGARKQRFVKQVKTLLKTTIRIAKSLNKKIARIINHVHIKPSLKGKGRISLYAKGKTQPVKKIRHVSQKRLKIKFSTRIPSRKLHKVEVRPAKGRKTFIITLPKFKKGGLRRKHLARKFPRRQIKKFQSVVRKLYKNAKSFQRKYLPNAKWWLRIYKQVMRIAAKQHKALTRLTGKAIKRLGFKWYKKHGRGIVNKARRILQKKLRSLHRIMLRQTIRLILKGKKTGLTQGARTLTQRMRKALKAYISVAKKLRQHLRKLVRVSIKRSKKHKVGGRIGRVGIKKIRKVPMHVGKVHSRLRIRHRQPAILRIRPGERKRLVVKLRRITSAKKWRHKRQRQLKVRVAQFTQRLKQFQRKHFPKAKWFMKMVKNVLRIVKERERKVTRIGFRAMKKRGFKWYSSFAKKKVTRVAKLLRQKLTVIEKIIARKGKALLKKKHLSSKAVKQILEKRVRRLLRGYILLSTRLTRNLKKFTQWQWRRSIKVKLALKLTRRKVHLSLRTLKSTKKAVVANRWLSRQVKQFGKALRTILKPARVFYKKNKRIGKWFISKVKNDYAKIWIIGATFFEKLRKKHMILGPRRFKAIYKPLINSKLRRLLNQLQKRVNHRLRLGKVVLRVGKKPAYSERLSRLMKCYPQLLGMKRKLAAKFWHRQQRAKFTLYVLRLLKNTKAWFKRQPQNVQVGYKLYRSVMASVNRHIMISLSAWSKGIKRHGFKWYHKYGREQFKSLSNIIKRKLRSLSNTIRVKCKNILGRARGPATRKLRRELVRVVKILLRKTIRIAKVFIRKVRQFIKLGKSLLKAEQLRKQVLRKKLGRRGFKLLQLKLKAVKRHRNKVARNWRRQQRRELKNFYVQFLLRAKQFQENHLPGRNWLLKLHKRLVKEAKRQHNKAIRVVLGAIKKHGVRWHREVGQKKFKEAVRTLRSKMQVLQAIFLRKTAALLAKKMNGHHIKRVVQLRAKSLLKPLHRLALRIRKHLQRVVKSGYKKLKSQPKLRVSAGVTKKWLTKFNVKKCNCSKRVVLANKWMSRQIKAIGEIKRIFKSNAKAWFQRNKGVGKWWIHKVNDGIAKRWIGAVTFLNQLRRAHISLGGKSFKKAYKAIVKKEISNFKALLGQLVSKRIRQGRLLLKSASNPSLRVRLAQLRLYRPRYQSLERSMSARIWRLHQTSKFGNFILRLLKKAKKWYKKQSANVRFGTKFHRQVINRVYGNFVGVLDTWQRAIKQRGFNWYVKNGRGMFKKFVRVTKNKTKAVLKSVRRKSVAILGHVVGKIPKSHKRRLARQIQILMGATLRAALRFNKIVSQFVVPKPGRTQRIVGKLTPGFRIHKVRPGKVKIGHLKRVSKSKLKVKLPVRKGSIKLGKKKLSQRIHLAHKLRVRQGKKSRAVIAKLYKKARTFQQKYLPNAKWWLRLHKRLLRVAKRQIRAVIRISARAIKKGGHKFYQKHVRIEAKKLRKILQRNLKVLHKVFLRHSVGLLRKRGLLGVAAIKQKLQKRMGSLVKGYILRARRLIRKFRRSLRRGYRSSLLKKGMPKRRHQPIVLNIHLNLHQRPQRVSHMKFTGLNRSGEQVACSCKRVAGGAPHHH